MVTRISDVIESLEDIRKIYGDLPVVAEVTRYQSRAEIVQVKHDTIHGAERWPMNYAVIEVGSGKENL